MLLSEVSALDRFQNVSGLLRRLLLKVVQFLIKLVKLIQSIFSVVKFTVNILSQISALRRNSGRIQLCIGRAQLNVFDYYIFKMYVFFSRKIILIKNKIMVNQTLCYPIVYNNSDNNSSKNRNNNISNNNNSSSNNNYFYYR